MRYIKNIFLSFVFIAFSAGLISCAPVNSGPVIDDGMAFEEARYQQLLVIEHHKDKLDQLMRVAHNIKKSNIDLCYGDNDIKQRETGLYFDASDFLMLNDQPVGSVNYTNDVMASPMVMYVAPTSPAAKTLKAEDLILAVDGTHLLEPSVKKNTEKAKKLLNEASKKGRDVPLLIERNGQQKNIYLSFETVCPSDVYLSVSSKAEQDVNAYADGERIYIRSSIISMAKTDDRLALVVGHELAHNTMSHIDKRQGNALIGGILGVSVAVLTGVDMSGSLANMGANAFSQEFEAEADYFGTYYAARAGYNTSNVNEFWREMAVKYPTSIHLAGSTHPSSAKRFVAIKHTAAEITAKKRKGEKIDPEMGGIGVSFETQKTPQEYN